MAETIIQKSRRTPAVEKAIYNQLEGRVLRKFFGLTAEDQDVLTEALGVRVDVNLNKDGGAPRG
jgi:hypothetical protein